MGTIALLAAIAGKMSTITSLRAYEYWPDNIVAPALLLRQTDSDPHTSFSGRASKWIELLVLVPIVSREQAQKELYPYMEPSGTSSILAALEADKTLTGTAEDFVAKNWSAPDGMEIDGIEFLGAKMEIEVYVTT